MSTFGDLFFNSVVLGGRGRRDAPDNASSSDGCGGDDDVELSLADDDASDGCGAGGEAPAAPDPRATFRDELLARPARPPAGAGAGFWAHFADVYDLATSLAADAGAARRAARDARADAFKAALPPLRAATARNCSFTAVASIAAPGAGGGGKGMREGMWHSFTCILFGDAHVFRKTYSAFHNNSLGVPGRVTNQISPPQASP